MTRPVSIPIHQTPGNAGRLRRPGKRNGDVISLNLVAMIDIVFLLLIFFMMQMRFHRPEGLLPTKLPRTHGAMADTEIPMSPLRVELRQFGEGPADYQIRILGMPPPDPQTFTELYERLLAIHKLEGFGTATPVLIVPTGDVRWDHVVNAYNAAVRARHTNIHFASTE